MYRKDLLCEVEAAGASLVEFTVKLRNSPGVMSKASSLIASLGINILSGFHTALATEVEGMWSFFAELTDNVTPEEVVEALKGVDGVVGASFLDAQLPGLIIDRGHFPLYVLDERAMVFRLGMLRTMFKHLMEIAGVAVGKVLLHQMGLETGEAKARRVQDHFKVEGRDALRIILAEHVAKGWGVPVIVTYDLNRKEAVIKVRELFECAAIAKATEPASEFFKGYLEGVLSVLMKTKLHVRETECIAKLDQHCIFVTD